MGKKQTIENLEHALAEANERAHRNAKDADYYRNRERARTRAEHAEQERQRKQAERAAALERVEHIKAGRLPFDNAESVSVTHEGDDVFVDVTVKLTKPEHQAVQDYLNSGREEPGYIRHLSNPAVISPGTIRLQDQINRMHVSAQRLRDSYFRGL